MDLNPNKKRSQSKYKYSFCDILRFLIMFIFTQLTKLFKNLTHGFHMIKLSPSKKYEIK